MDHENKLQQIPQQEEAIIVEEVRTKAAGGGNKDTVGGSMTPATYEKAAGFDEERSSEGEEESCVREKLKRHRREMAGRVWVPEMWGQERNLKEWSDCRAFDRVLLPQGLMSARDCLVEECRRANSAAALRSNPT